jgi:hypothetical protein
MNSILTIINFNNNFDKYIYPLILLVPRTSLFIGIISHIHEIVFKNKMIELNQNIKLCFMDKENNSKEIEWYQPVGVYFDIISENNYKYIELLCDKSNDNGIFKTPITDIKQMIQQRFKQGLGTILNSTKFFVELPVKEIDEYVSFATQIKYDYKNQKIFSDILNNIYDKKKSYRIPIIFHYESRINMYALDFTNDNIDETLKDTVMRSEYNKDILNNKNIIINGLNLKNIENVPTIWAIKNLCCSDLFLHIVII